MWGKYPPIDTSLIQGYLNALLQSGIYKQLSKELTAKVEKKVNKPFSKHKTALLPDLKHKLTTYHSKPPYLYGTG
jgi:hypothetical protein